LGAFSRKLFKKASTARASFSLSFLLSVVTRFTTDRFFFKSTAVALRDKVLNWSLRHLLQCSASISFNRGQARSHPPAGEQKRALCNEHQTDPQPRTNTGNPHEIHIKNPEYDADNDRTNP
jgi:hypothetical protein